MESRSSITVGSLHPPSGRKAEWLGVHGRKLVGILEGDESFLGSCGFLDLSGIRKDSS